MSDSSKEEQYERESKLREEIAKLYQAGDWLRTCLCKSIAIDADDSKEFYDAITAWDAAAAGLPSINKG